MKHLPKTLAVASLLCLLASFTVAHSGGTAVILKSIGPGDYQARQEALTLENVSPPTAVATLPSAPGADLTKDAGRLRIAIFDLQGVRHVRDLMRMPLSPQAFEKPDPPSLLDQFGRNPIRLAFEKPDPPRLLDQFGLNPVQLAFEKPDPPRLRDPLGEHSFDVAFEKPDPPRQHPPTGGDPRQYAFEKPDPPR